MVELVTWRVFALGAKDALVASHRSSDAAGQQPIRNFHQARPGSGPLALVCMMDHKKYPWGVYEVQRVR